MSSSTPPVIARLAAALQASPLDGEALQSVLSQHLDDEAVAALRAMAEFREDRYVRLSLHRTRDVELRLLCWGPGQSSGLHDHGEASCAFRVLAGRATEVRLGRPDRLLAAGDVGEAAPGVVHNVLNTGTGALVTLHVYAPPLPVDQPSTEAGLRVVIVGGGFSGVAAAMHLLKRGDAGLRVTLVEPGPGLGQGVAYGTADRTHVLNVPAAGMSWDPEDPGDFLRYARSRGIAAGPRSLLSRALYAEYTADRLADAVRHAAGRLRVVRGRVVAVEPSAEGGHRVALADGTVLPAAHVVLATGHGEQVLPQGLAGLSGDARFHANPWECHVQTGLPLDARLLLVGTGLTALDLLGTLRRAGHRGQVDVVSLTGRWPKPHLPSVVWTGDPPAIDTPPTPATADALAGWLRASFQQADAAGAPWQAVMEALRPRTAALWASMSDAEQQRFLTVWRPQWERLRHRAPLAQIAAVTDWEASGWVHRRAGSPVSARVLPDGALSVVTAHDGQTHEHTVDHVILCTGAISDPRALGDPWPGLLAQGSVTPHPLGVVTDEAGAVLRDGVPVPGLWAAGGLLRPRFFEVTAVPDIARRSERLAKSILES